MNLIQAIILGIIQGLTEFLPVSSSGHLVLGEKLLGVVKSADLGIAFEVFVHFGTLLAVVTIFWHDFLGLTRAFFSLFSINRISLKQKYQQDKDFKWMILIIAATLPAGIIGLFLEKAIEEAFNSVLLVCIMLIVTGLILIVSRFFLNGKKPINFAMALLIGFAQAFAIIPGISRSGSTISMGLALGMEREKAARFSFLLSIPIIAGATILKINDLLQNPPMLSVIITLVAGTICAYIAGIIAIKFLMAVVRKGRLDRFAYYCFAVGISGIIWLTAF